MMHGFCVIEHVHLRSYLIYLIGTFIFVDKGLYHVDMVYLRYCLDFEQIHEYKLETAYLVYLYLKLGESYLWKIKHLTGSWTLLMVIYYY